MPVCSGPEVLSEREVIAALKCRRYSRPAAISLLNLPEKVMAKVPMKNTPAKKGGNGKSGGKSGKKGC